MIKIKAKLIINLVIQDKTTTKKQISWFEFIQKPVAKYSERILRTIS